MSLFLLAAQSELAKRTESSTKEVLSSLFKRASRELTFDPVEEWKEGEHELSRSDAVRNEFRRRIQQRTAVLEELEKSGFFDFVAETLPWDNAFLSTAEIKQLAFTNYRGDSESIGGFLKSY